MPLFCRTCGTHYPHTPTACPICEDERQYLPPGGQQWTTPDDLHANHKNSFNMEEPGLISIQTQPEFAIGQRALLIQTPGGNVLWDCISLIDAETIEAVQKLGGLSAIAISHPHFFSHMAGWSAAFGNIPIYLHASHRAYIQEVAPSLQLWVGETHTLWDGLTLIRCGGHFEGSTVLHSAEKGFLLTGDTISPVAHAGWVTFMYSFPNSLPLSAREVQHILDAVRPYDFTRLYGGWPNKVIRENAKAAVMESGERYIQRLG